LALLTKVRSTCANHQVILACMCRRILQLEEEMVQEMCSDVLRVKPDLVITEKGVSDLAQHFLMKAGVSVIRRVRKTDNNRIARYEQFVSELILY